MAADSFHICPSCLAYFTISLYFCPHLLLNLATFARPSLSSLCLLLLFCPGLQFVSSIQHRPRNMAEAKLIFMKKYCCY